MRSSAFDKGALVFKKRDCVDLLHSYGFGDNYDFGDNILKKLQSNLRNCYQTKLVRGIYILHILTF